MIKILRCDCIHPFQDARYGKGRRVHNEGASENAATAAKFRCTVCSSEQTSGKAAN